MCRQGCKKGTWISMSPSNPSLPPTYCRTRIFVLINNSSPCFGPPMSYDISITPRVVYRLVPFRSPSRPHFLIRHLFRLFYLSGKKWSTPNTKIITSTPKSQKVAHRWGRCKSWSVRRKDEENKEDAFSRMEAHYTAPPQLLFVPFYCPNEFLITRGWK